MTAIFVLSILLNVVLGFALYRFVVRVREVDDVIEAMVGDTQIFIEYFIELLKQPMFSNSSQLVALHENMKQMLSRYVSYIEDAELARNIHIVGQLGQEEEQGKASNYNPPVAVD